MRKILILTSVLLALIGLQGCSEESEGTLVIKSASGTEISICAIENTQVSLYTFPASPRDKIKVDLLQGSYILNNNIGFQIRAGKETRVHLKSGIVTYDD